MLKTLLHKWSISNTEQANIIYLDMKEYFNYIRKEFTTYQDVQININLKLITKMESNKSAFTKAESKLLQKKDEFFKTANFPKWELSNENFKIKNELIKDKDLAYSKMLPKVS